MDHSRLVRKTQGGEANPSNFGLQTMILAIEITLKISV